MAAVIAAKLRRFARKRQSRAARALLLHMKKPARGGLFQYVRRPGSLDVEEAAQLLGA
jgi:hypothetical protein